MTGDIFTSLNAQLQARSQEVRGNKDYVESPWLSDMAELGRGRACAASTPQQGSSGGRQRL